MLKVNNQKIEYNYFPDGTLNIKGDGNLRDGKVLISWYYENDAEFMALAFLTKYYQVSNNQVILFIPYVPNARMDRVEEVGDIFTMKYFGELINSLNFHSVFVMEPHSSVVSAVINRCHILDADQQFNNIIYRLIQLTGDTPIIFFPDDGAMKRYRHHFNDNYFINGKQYDNFIVAYGSKDRDWATGKISGLTINGVDPDKIAGRYVLIRDDICSKGGTVYYSAKKLKELGAANIFLFIPHCENTIFKGEFGEEKKNLLDTGLVDHIYTTDSIFTATQMSDKITVLTVAPEGW